MNVTAKQVAPQELSRMAQTYYQFLGSLGKQIEEVRDFIAAYPAYHARPRIPVWDLFVQQGEALAQAVLGSKEIPAGQGKNLELAIRLFMASQRQPNKPVEWLDKNYAHLNFLYNAAIKWSDKKEGESAQRFDVGPFTVHNTMGLAGADLEGIKDTVTKAVMLIKGLNVPGIDKVLYGDVMIVGRLSKGTTLAWYYPNEDAVYVRPFKNAGFDELESLIHELGHRYTHKFIDKTTWESWRRYHQQLEWNAASVHTELPKVGDALPFAVKGIKSPVIIQKIEREPGYPHPLYYLSDTKAVPGPSLRKLMDQVASRAATYPTPYSAKSADEHFCEALAYRAMGKLKEPHLNAFKAIIEEGKPGVDAVKLASPTRVVARYMKSKSWFGLEIPDSPIVEKAKEIKNRVSQYLSLAVLPGTPSTNVSERTLAKHAEDRLPDIYGFYADYTITRPHRNAMDAFQEAEKMVRDFVKMSATHQATTVMLAYWKDADMWSGVINSYEMR